jgi:phosphate starvation-inducible PhoH-like protein
LTQKDLPADATSGLDVAMRVLKQIEGIELCTLSSQDVVRHPLVQQIVKAYEVYENKQQKSASQKNAQRGENREYIHRRRR